MATSFQDIVPLVFRPSPRREEVRRRYAAFQSRLDAAHKVAARVAIDFFGFLCDLERVTRAAQEGGDPEERETAVAKAHELAAVAYARFVVFGSQLGCRSLEEACDRLDRLVAYARTAGLDVAPEWWWGIRDRKAIHYVRNLRERALARNAWLEELRKRREEASRSRRRNQRPCRPEECPDFEEGGAA